MPVWIWTLVPAIGRGGLEQDDTSLYIPPMTSVTCNCPCESTLSLVSQKAVNNWRHLAKWVKSLYLTRCRDGRIRNFPDGKRTPGYHIEPTGQSFRTCGHRAAFHNWTTSTRHYHETQRILQGNNIFYMHRNKTETEGQWKGQAYNNSSSVTPHYTSEPKGKEMDQRLHNIQHDTLRVFSFIKSGFK